MGQHRNILFVKQKLLNGLSTLNSGNLKSPRTLTCLSVWFGLEFNTDAISCAVACTQVEHHMQLCLAATIRFERLITIARSEPLLAEAASQLMHESWTNLVCHLANHSDLNCVDCGWHGELVATLIIMQACDAVS